MSRDDTGYDTPKWRTFWLAVGFAVLVGIGIVTVFRPELEDEPTEDNTAEMQTSQESEPDAPLQE